MNNLGIFNFVVHYISRVLEFAHFKFTHKYFIFLRSLEFAHTRKYTGWHDNSVVKKLYSRTFMLPKSNLFTEMGLHTAALLLKNL